MKQIVITFLAAFNVFFAIASGDSTRVSFCTTTGDICYGRPSYSESIEVIDSAGRVIREDEYSLSGCWEGIIDSIFRKSASNIYQYDANGNIVSHLNSIYFLNDSIKNQYTYSYDSLDRRLTEVRTRLHPLPVLDYFFEKFEYYQDSLSSDLYMHNPGSGLDTSYFRTMEYDSAMRKIKETFRRYETSSGNLNTFYIQYYMYDSTGNLSTLSYKNLLPSNDSTRITYFYNVLNNISEASYERFDTLNSIWELNEKTIYNYDSLNYLDIAYDIRCFAGICTDTSSYVDYTVDSIGRITRKAYYSYPGEWNGSSAVNFNAYGDTLYYGSSSPTENGCGESEYIYFTYSNSQEVIHSRTQTLASCAFMYVDCDYYNLNSDSMVINVSSPLTVCANDTVYPVVFHAGGNEPLQYHWSPGIYFSDSTIKYPYLINNVSGTYTLTVTDSSGRSITDTVSVQTHPDLIHPLDISAFGVPPCEGVVQLTFSPDSLNGTWYSHWEFDGSTYWEDTIVAGSSGLYSLIINNDYCTYRTDTNLVLIEPQPLTINIIGSYHVCEGNSVTLFTQDQFNFTWNTGSTADTIVADTSGYYYISMTDTNSCPDTSNMIYVYIGSFESAELIRDTSFCSGDSVRLNPGFYYSYFWSDSSTQNHLVVTDPGVYSLRVTDYFGCPNHDTITVTENLLPAVNLGTDTLLCRNTSIILDPGNFQSYQWQDGTSDSVFIPVYSGVDTVIISVLVSDSANCFASDTVAIFYDVCNEIVFNAGSSSYVWPIPADDIFYLQFSDKRGEIMVFNSLGEIVYKDRLFNSASINCKSWPSGSYFYKVIKEDGLNISGKIFIRHP